MALVGAGLVFYFRKVKVGIEDSEDEDEVKRIEMQVNKYRESKQEGMQKMEIGSSELKGQMVGARCGTAF